MPGVFISYRREDSGGYTGRLFDILSAEFGRENTYMDLDTIQAGDDFTSIIEQKIGVSDALVAVIGDRWLTIAGQNGMRRLEDPRDFVRVEIARALKLGIRVIPVLVSGAVMPEPAQLPPDLRALAKRQAIEIRDASFHSDAERLIGALERDSRGIRARLRQFRAKPLLAAIVTAALAVLLAVGILRWDRHPASRAVAGRWSAVVKYDWGDTHRELFHFEVDGQELTGTAGFLGDPSRVILDGRIAANRIAFITKTLSRLSAEEKPSEDTHRYKGVVEGDSIRFTMLTESAISPHFPVQFTATRIPEK
jgi:hypothetical protein